MNKSEIFRLKCKHPYEGETWYFKTNVECDKYFFTLEKDKWYEIILLDNKKYGIKINLDTIIYEMEYFILRHFYSYSELRKEKIKKILNEQNY